MEPVTIQADQCAHLPEYELVIYAADQPQYRRLPVVKLAGREGRVISRWTLTDDERAAIAQGEDLYLEQLTFNNPLQPILPTVGLSGVARVDKRASHLCSFCGTDTETSIDPHVWEGMTSKSQWSHVDVNDRASVGLPVADFDARIQVNPSILAKKE